MSLPQDKHCTGEMLHSILLCWSCTVPIKLGLHVSIWCSVAVVPGHTQWWRLFHRGFADKLCNVMCIVSLLCLSPYFGSFIYLHQVIFWFVWSFCIVSLYVWRGLVLGFGFTIRPKLQTCYMNIVISRFRLLFVFCLYCLGKRKFGHRKYRNVN